MTKESKSKILKLAKPLPEHKQLLLAEMLELYAAQQYEDKREARQLLLSIDAIFEALPEEKQKVNKFMKVINQ